TLEWYAQSPPEPFNFALLPVVESRDPLWTASGEVKDHLTGVLIDPLPRLGRDTLATTSLEGESDHIVTLPGPSLWPLALAVALTVSFLGAMASLWFVGVGAVLAFVSLLGWFWPASRGQESP